VTRVRADAHVSGPSVNARLLPWLGTAGAIAIGLLLALAGSDQGLRAGGVPVFAACVAVAFVIGWAGFVPAFVLRTERFYDLLGSVTFLTLALIALVAGTGDARAWIIAALVGVWAVRLGVFLTMRIRHDGFDRRFTRIREHFPTFLMTWTLQTVWTIVSFGPGLAAMTSEVRVPPDLFLAAGIVLWLVGFVVEVVADAQKRRFRAREENAGRFIREGLWAWSRHPNYFGEILLWTGIAICALPALRGWQYATLLSPVFIWLLLTRISGVRMLEASARRRWGDDPEYAEYTARTPRLIPIPRARTPDSKSGRP